MAFLDKRRFGWRDVVMFACVIATAVFGVRGQHAQENATSDNRRAALLVALSVCQQANVLVAATLANKTPAQQKLLKPLVTQYLDPLNRALVALGHAPNCDAS